VTGTLVVGAADVRGAADVEGVLVAGGLVVAGAPVVVVTVVGGAEVDVVLVVDDVVDVTTDVEVVTAGESGCWAARWSSISTGTSHADSSERVQMPTTTPSASYTGPLSWSGCSLRRRR
jgi:hypothetical protein